MAQEVLADCGMLVAMLPFLDMCRPKTHRHFCTASWQLHDLQSVLQQGAQLHNQCV